jgi:hypothetical protein
MLSPHLGENTRIAPEQRCGEHCANITAVAARTNVGRLPQGRYWVGFSGFFTAVFGVMFLFGAIRQGPNDEPGEIAAFLVPSLLVTASMSRVTMYATADALVVRNLVWKRHIAWARIVSFRVKPYKWSRHYAASVAVRTTAGADIRIWATMTRSKPRAREIATAIESLAATHNIPADLDPEPLRCRWF